ncbi:hypothetical protein [Nocardia cyriacigeorgica]|uniref:hypothetical protein n=1 Tax=Nocardia cyriacigeorgica TaxID=135487 RepID=UPI00189535B8|nr:hypothetical protein [Nocardia cyriacigeorgica]MBF6416963.1 hypothetical protein [Nocardia cyriacigeorgica]
MSAHDQAARVLDAVAAELDRTAFRRTYLTNERMMLLATRIREAAAVLTQPTPT